VTGTPSAKTSNRRSRRPGMQRPAKHAESGSQSRFDPHGPSIDRHSPRDDSRMCGMHAKAGPKHSPVSMFHCWPGQQQWPDATSRPTPPLQMPRHWVTSRGFAIVPAAQVATPMHLCASSAQLSPGRQQCPGATSRRPPVHSRAHSVGLRESANRPGGHLAAPTHLPFQVCPSQQQWPGATCILPSGHGRTQSSASRGFGKVPAGQ